MKISNFIEPLSIQSQREFNRWVRFSTICIGTCLGVMTCVEIMQLLKFFEYRSFAKKYTRLTASHNQITDQKNKLASQEQELKTKISSIMECTDNRKTCINHIKCLFSSGIEHVQLQSYSAAEHATTVTINCPTIAHAQQYITTLTNGHLFHNLTIDSVQHNEKNGFTITLKTNS